MRAAALAIALLAPALAAAQTCTYNPSQPNAVNFGTIDPLGTATATFTITVNYKCTGNANAVFTITGQNDLAPGAYRLRNVTAPTQYMRYSIAVTNVPGTKITLDGSLPASSYANGWAGNYTDTLTVLVQP
jgi:spore coat protein U-like protein